VHWINDNLLYDVEIEVGIVECNELRGLSQSSCKTLG